MRARCIAKVINSPDDSLRSLVSSVSVCLCVSFVAHNALSCLLFSTFQSTRARSHPVHVAHTNTPCTCVVRRARASIFTTNQHHSAHNLIDKLMGPKSDVFAPKSHFQKEKQTMHLITTNTA